ncbi:hypothetical protein [uncultured Lacinutrix sp.]|uniref:hypothetical protein n=1 Tax=uncultured Lacinutrix sp. TaxID=574032 RepID=UPI0026202122|nr:hypothetical protein [uncultured Lacinutrix sp.]
MKHLKTYISILAIILAISTNAQDNDSSIQEAVNKGKTDLIDVLSKAGKDFNFGIDAESVKSATMASPISYQEMDFNRLLNYNQQGLNGTLNSELKKIVPLVNGNKVITTIGVSNAKQGRYQVTDLINHQYHNELNQLPNAIKQNNFSNLKIVYVPNLNTVVYSFNGKSYTSYKGRSVRQAIDDEALLQLLKADAVAFQNKYGSQLGDKRLLN